MARRIRLEFRGELRRAEITNDDLTLTELELMVQRIFGKISPNDALIFKYPDVDGAMVTIGNDTELRIAMEDMEYLKLSIQLEDDSLSESVANISLEQQLQQRQQPDRIDSRLNNIHHEFDPLGPPPQHQNPRSPPQQQKQQTMSPPPPLPHQAQPLQQQQQPHLHQPLGPPPMSSPQQYQPASGPPPPPPQQQQLQQSTQPPPPPPQYMRLPAYGQTAPQQPPMGPPSHSMNQVPPPSGPPGPPGTPGPLQPHAHQYPPPSTHAPQQMLPQQQPQMLPQQQPQMLPQQQPQMLPQQQQQLPPHQLQHQQQQQHNRPPPPPQYMRLPS